MSPALPAASRAARPTVVAARTPAPPALAPQPRRLVRAGARGGDLLLSLILSEYAS